MRVAESGPVDHEAVLAGAAADDQADCKQREFLFSATMQGWVLPAVKWLLVRWEVGDLAEVRIGRKERACVGESG